MTTQVYRAALLAMATCGMSAAGCGGGGSSPSVPTAPTPPFSGQVSAQDATGDAAANTQRTPSPDLIGVETVVDGTNLRMTWRFAAGTFDTPTTCAVLDIDIDQSSATGQPDNGLGVDYQVQAYNGQTILGNVRTGQGATVPSRAPVVNGDAVEVTLPLSLLGNDDGRMHLRAKSVVLATGYNSGALDYTPDVSQPVLRLQ